MGLHKPEVIEGEGFVKCILPRPSFGKGAASEDKEAKKILALFEISEEIAISDVMKALHISRPTAGRRLVELINKDQIEQVGKGKGTRYRKLKRM